MVVMSDPVVQSILKGREMPDYYPIYLGRDPAFLAEGTYKYDLKCCTCLCNENSVIPLNGCLDGLCVIHDPTVRQGPLHSRILEVLQRAMLDPSLIVWNEVAIPLIAGCKLGSVALTLGRERGQRPWL